ncbi:MAG: hypothetical protein NUV80_03690 [Candidatus Berkelbacteria bacterium]|nr:hypothetical protein [Candidatus Berkelbacteria bacterium]
MPTTLYDYYKAQGKPLPSVAERAPLAAQYGITNYTGTAEQNSSLLAKLTAGGSAVPTPPAVGGGPLPPDGEPANTGLGELGNLRNALRSALSEAAQTTSRNRMQQLSGLVGGGASPSVINAAIGLAQKGLQTSQETVFGDVMAAYKDANEAKQKELDRINELRAEFGSAVPSSVTDLSTALDLVAPLVDKENRLRLSKMATDQAADNDIESWAESYAKGEVAIGNIPAAIRTQVKVRADAIKTKLEGEAKTEYKSRIAFRLEKKTSDFEQERGLAMQDDNLTVAEQREVIDYIDGLEASQKASKKKGGGFFSFLNPPAPAAPSNFSPAPNNQSSPFGPTNPNAPTNYTPSLKPFEDAFVTPFRNILKK